MKTDIIKRGLLGFPLGIAIGHVITVVISLIFAKGYFAFCHPSLVASMGSEIKAVVIQTLLCGFIGTVMSISTVIWENEDWSILKQTGLFFVIVSATNLPIAYILHWMDRSAGGILVYIGIFAILFIVIWIVQYLIYRNKIMQINAKLK